jgi:hypothetical protein
MEPEGSLPCWHEPTTGPYPEPDESILYHLILLGIGLTTSYRNENSLLRNVTQGLSTNWKVYLIHTTFRKSIVLPSSGDSSFINFYGAIGVRT